MDFIVAEEIWIPREDSQYRLEKWVPEEDFYFRSENGASRNGAGPWRIGPYYHLFKMDGTELLESTDWNHVMGFLQSVLGEDEIPNDFSM